MIYNYQSVQTTRICPTNKGNTITRVKHNLFIYVINNNCKV